MLYCTLSPSNRLNTTRASNSSLAFSLARLIATKAALFQVMQTTKNTLLLLRSCTRNTDAKTKLISSSPQSFVQLPLPPSLPPRPRNLPLHPPPYSAPVSRRVAVLESSSPPILDRTVDNSPSLPHPILSSWPQLRRTPWRRGEET